MNKVKETYYVEEEVAEAVTAAQFDFRLNSKSEAAQFLIQTGLQCIRERVIQGKKDAEAAKKKARGLE